MSAKSTPYRFRPRFIALAFLSLSMGVVLVVASVLLTPDRLSGIFSGVSGVAGIFLGFAYLRSPLWRLAVDVQADDLVLWNGREERMRLPWRDVQRVVVDSSRQSCYVDGGSPDRSLLVPGPGVAARYYVRKKSALIAAILSHVSEDQIFDTKDPCISTGPQA